MAEDDAAVRTIARKVFEQFGYTVIEARDGEDAVKKFLENKDKVHLVVLDVLMPKKNGKEAYEEIRKIRPDVKVIFTSGYTADILHKKGILEEGINFLSKPISTNDLIRKVREVLDRQV
jgi:DNA-binding response OmpR family regulator